jgi:ribosome biogenesis GTPase
MDQYDSEELESVNDLIADYTRIGYPAIRSSSYSRLGIEEIRGLVSGKTVLISGHSGAGKSTLINELIPGLNLRTEEISDWSNKGQHTTTFSEMHELPQGGYLVDTPGIKGFGIVDIPKEELAHHFKEFFDLLPLCKFHNCKHLNEPGCAVRKGLEDGNIPASRYASYVSMMNDEEERSVYR